MNETWLLLDSGPGEPARNMAFDEALLGRADKIGQPILRFYGWTQPAASFGYFQSINEVEQATLLRPLVRRPTAGGIVAHDADWTYSLTIPAHHEWHRVKAEQSYTRIHDLIRSAFAALKIDTRLAEEARRPMPGQCFEGYEIHDLVWQGRKIAGAAQRRTRKGLLIQGSVQPPPLGLKRADWQRAMCEVAGVQWREWKPDDALLELREQLMTSKHTREEYQRKR